MSDTPEAGARCKVQTDDGEEIAVYTGHMYASEDGSRIIENVKSWEEAPSEGLLRIRGLPDTLPEAPVGDRSDDYIPEESEEEE